MIKINFRVIHKLYLSGLICSALCYACVDTGLQEVALSLSAKGTTLSQVIEGQNGTEISINRAELAFGPLYLCAGANAGDLCDTARLEWLDSAVIDLINDQTVNLGILQGSSGVVQSWMYDLGISSQLTQREPFILEAARALNDHSLVIEGEALVDGVEIPFSARLKIAQSEDTERGIPIIRKSGSERFYREIKDDASMLLITFDPRPWLSRLDFSSYVTHERCEAESDQIVCDGSLERRCDGSQEIESRDCADIGQVCLAKFGCQEQLDIKEGSTAYRVIRNALMVGERPSFTWSP